MRVQVDVMIDAPRDEVWRLVSDIENASGVISGIEDVEVLERPASGMRGLKWRETRTIFGKTAVETMWVTDADEGSFYTTEARSHGSIYRTKVSLTGTDGGIRLAMDFRGEGETLGAKLLSLLFAPLMKSAARKALQRDLEDVKAAAERGGDQSRRRPAYG